MYEIMMTINNSMAGVCGLLWITVVQREGRLMMNNVIHIFGGSGSGTTTLGRAMKDAYGFEHLDVDDYYWLPAKLPFTEKRGVRERQDLLRGDIEAAGNCVISGSLCGWGDIFIPCFSLAVYMVIPADLRMERLLKREKERFGDRISVHGDMYENHMEFVEWARSYDMAGSDIRSAVLHEEWQKQILCPVIRMDGALSMQEQLMKIRGYLKL